MPTDYPAVFKSLLDPALASGKTISMDRLFSDPSLGVVKRSTKLQHLKKFISEQVQYVGVVEGALPNDATMIKAIEGKLGGRITEQNVVDANGHCADIVLSAARPVLETFVKESLAAHVSGAMLNVALTDLINFLLKDYGAFSRGAGNSLVSTAGRMNELLLMSCLQAAGMVEGTDFTRTGTRSEGDIVIHCHAGSKVPLGVEVKSHHARERLQRGLTDVSEPKVGAGYFVNAG